MDVVSIAVAIGSSCLTALIAFVAFKASANVRIQTLETRATEDRITASQNASQLRNEFTTQLSATRMEISNTIAHAMNERLDRTTELKQDVVAFQARMDDRFNDLHDMIAKSLDRTSEIQAELAGVQGELRGRQVRSGSSSSSTPATRGG